MDDLLASIRRIIADEPAVKQPDVEAEEVSTPRARRQPRPESDPAPDLVRRSIKSALEGEPSHENAAAGPHGDPHARQPTPWAEDEAAASGEAELTSLDRAAAETTRMALANAIDKCDDIKPAIALPDQSFASPFDQFESEADISIYRVAGDRVRAHQSRDESISAYAAAARFDEAQITPGAVEHPCVDGQGLDESEAETPTELALAELLAAVDREVAAAGEANQVAQTPDLWRAPEPCDVASEPATQAEPSELAAEPAPEAPALPSLSQGAHGAYADETPKGPTTDTQMPADDEMAAKIESDAHEHDRCEGDDGLDRDDAAPTPRGPDEDDAFFSLIANFDEEDDVPDLSKAQGEGESVASPLDLDALMEPELREAQDAVHEPFDDDPIAAESGEAEPQDREPESAAPRGTRMAEAEVAGTLPSATADLYAEPDLVGVEPAKDHRPVDTAPTRTATPRETEHGGAAPRLIGHRAAEHEPANSHDAAASADKAAVEAEEGVAFVAAGRRVAGGLAYPSAAGLLAAPHSTEWMRPRRAKAAPRERNVERQHHMAGEHQQTATPKSEPSSTFEIEERPIVEPRATPANDEGSYPIATPPPQSPTGSGGRWRPGSVRAVFQDIAARNRRVFESRMTSSEKATRPAEAECEARSVEASTKGQAAIAPPSRVADLEPPATTGAPVDLDAPEGEPDVVDDVARVAADPHLEASDEPKSLDELQALDEPVEQSDLDAQSDLHAQDDLDAQEVSHEPKDLDEPEVSHEQEVLQEPDILDDVEPLDELEALNDPDAIVQAGIERLTAVDRLDSSPDSREGERLGHPLPEQASSTMARGPREQPRASVRHNPPMGEPVEEAARSPSVREPGTHSRSLHRPAPTAPRATPEPAAESRWGAASPTAHASWQEPHGRSERTKRPDAMTPTESSPRTETAPRSEGNIRPLAAHPAQAAGALEAGQRAQAPRADWPTRQDAAGGQGFGARPNPSRMRNPQRPESNGAAAPLATDPLSRPFAAWHDRPASAPARPRPSETDVDELMSTRTRTLTSAAFENLSRSFATSASAGAKAQTVDEIAREALRPLLREWLDANLTVIVERLVREEIERVTGRR